MSNSNCFKTIIDILNQNINTRINVTHIMRPVKMTLIKICLKIETQQRKQAVVI